MNSKIFLWVILFAFINWHYGSVQAKTPVYAGEKERIHEKRDLSDGLVAYYPFNGNADDESGNGNNGIVNGAELTADRYGNQNSAYHFSGLLSSRYDKIIVDDDPVFHSSHMSISLWVKGSPTRWARLINKGKRGEGYSLLNYENKGIMRSWFHYTSLSDEVVLSKLTDSETVIDDNVWKHVAVTFDGKIVNVFFNGKLDVSTSLEGDYTLYQSTKDLEIGSGSDGSVEYPFNGDLDDIRIYNRALSESEVMQLYTGNTMADLPAVELLSLKISPSMVMLTQPGAESRLLLQGYFNNGEFKTPSNITWISDNEAVAKMVGDRVTAVADGKTLITASSGNVSASVVVNVNIQPMSIDVEPSLVLLKAGDVVTPVVRANYADGFRKEVNDFSLSATMLDGEDVIEIQNMKIAAVKEGTASVECSAEISGVSLFSDFLVNVSEPVPVYITPSIIKGNAGETLTVKIDGGETPYSVNFGSLENINNQWLWNVELPDESGFYAWNLTDQKGAAVVLNAEVYAPLSIMSNKKRGRLRKGLTAKPGGIIVLRPAGGAPPYAWSATAGQLSDSETLDDSPITYTLPNAVGTFTVSVTDGNGQSFDFHVSSAASLVVAPRKIFAGFDENHEINVFGGIPPYRLTAESGDMAEVDESLFVYKTPGIAGEYIIAVTDASGASQEIRVKVYQPLLVSPATAYMRRNESKFFSILGGSGDDAGMILQAVRGEVSTQVINRGFTYTAPDQTGSDTVIITDIDGEQVKIAIEVISDNFFVTPANAALLKDEKRVFRTVGGIKEGLLWTVDEGDISSDTENHTFIIYEAPNRLTACALSAVDKQSRKAQAEIHVISDKVMITPKEVFLKTGEETLFRGALGAGSYVFTATGGDLSEEADMTDRVRYRSPNRAGEYYVTVTDEVGNTAKARIFVSGGSTRTLPPAVLINDITSPLSYTNSPHQPMAVGEVQNGGTLFSLSTDFPNYCDCDDREASMNYYVGLFPERLNILILFDISGGVYVNNLKPYIVNPPYSDYRAPFDYDFCTPGGEMPEGTYHVYALAVDSQYDPMKNLTLEPASPFDLWHFTFDFNGCR